MCPDFGSPIWSSHQISHLELNFDVFLGGKTQNFLCSAFCSSVFDEYQTALIPRKLPCPGKVLVMCLYYNDLSAEEYFKKIMKMLNVLIFSLIILNSVKKSILYPS